MVRLSRETRFALVPTREAGSTKPINSWAGWPTTNLIAPRIRLQMIVGGDPDPVTGYLCNIKVIDDLLRQVVTRSVLPMADQAMTAESLLQLVFREARQGWDQALAAPNANTAEPPPKIESLTLHLSPYLRYTTFSQSEASSSMIELTEQFEFSAAHRLHCDTLGVEENGRLFGKCNNPEGHGHNYVVEVSVGAEVDAVRGQVISLEEFERTVDRLVIDRLDHKHLNRDVEYFADVNPSVENIAVAIYHWLDGQFGNAALRKVKVFETPKTWAEYSGKA